MKTKFHIGDIAMQRMKSIEHALSWAHLNGFAFAHDAIREYSLETRTVVAVDFSGCISFHDDGAPLPRFSQKLFPVD